MDWSENTTVTGRSNSDYSESHALLHDNKNQTIKELLKKNLRRLLLGLFFCLTLLSPLIMVAIPKMEFMNLRHSQLKCGVGCEGLQISFAFRLLILAVGSWALFDRRQQSILPCVELLHFFISVLLMIFFISFWVVYGLNNMEDRRLIKYESILQYASSYLNCLICLQYLGVLLLMIRQNMHPQYFLHILRSPDGESRSFQISNASIQEAARRSLNCYYTQFHAHNKTSSKSNGQKKKAQLITSTEEAFKQLRRISDDHISVNNHALDCHAAARALFPHVIQPLHKYFKSTNQQSSHTMDSIIKHLTIYIMYGMAPKAFLEKYLSSVPTLQVLLMLL
jgi:vang-like